MRHSLLLVVCVVSLVAGSASAQQPGYYPRSYTPMIDTGGGYRITTGSPYYQPASMMARYYTPGYSPAYYPAYNYLPAPRYVPSGVYEIVGYGGYLRPIP